MPEDILKGLDRRLDRSSLIVAIVAVAALFFLHAG
jgi:hypothetical protein